MTEQEFMTKACIWYKRAYQAWFKAGTNPADFLYGVDNRLIENMVRSNVHFVYDRGN